MGRVADTFMKRDNLSEEQAKISEMLLREEIWYGAETGDPAYVEEVLAGAGFEMDYLIDLI